MTPRPKQKQESPYPIIAPFSIMKLTPEQQRHMNEIAWLVASYTRDCGFCRNGGCYSCKRNEKESKKAKKVGPNP